MLIGEAAPLISAALHEAGVAVVQARDMVEAVERARSGARRGDVVLLSPACSSFDMFRSYSDRGDAFQRAVEALEPKGGA